MFALSPLNVTSSPCSLTLIPESGRGADTGSLQKRRLTRLRDSKDQKCAAASCTVRKAVLCYRLEESNNEEVCLCRGHRCICSYGRNSDDGICRRSSTPAAARCRAKHCRRLGR